MAKLVFEGKEYERREGETVLKALRRHGVQMSFSCRKGVCMVCLLRVEAGEVQGAAVEGVQPRLAERGYFLACRHVPEGDARVERPRDADVYGRAVVAEKALLTRDVCRLRLEAATPLYYHAGQFVNLRRADGLSRSYSLASVPQQDGFLELHVKRVTLGQMSQWIFDELSVGDSVDVQGPEGRCFYRGDDPGRSLLLVGTGTGVAPLAAVVRDALHHGHTGPIHLYHGAREAEGLYLDASLRALAARHPQFHYHPCVSGPACPEAARPGRADALARADHPELAGWHVFLCGLPDMVTAARDMAVRQGADPADVRADAFETADMDPETTEEPNRYPPTDAEMWAAFGEGPLLREILEDFYTRVYADPKLSPFFAGTTKDHSIGKQYNFLYRVYTGESVYFGDRPRNAHNWMVISDELFDYRGELMATVLREHGVPEHLVRRFRAMEESYRPLIVKNKPWSKIRDGIVYPVDGYEDLPMDCGAVCDACGRFTEPGEWVRYHIRLGTLSCTECCPELLASIPEASPEAAP